MEEEIMEELREIKKLVILNNKNTFNVQDLCAFTGMSKIWVYQLVNRKEIPHYKRGSKLYFDRAEIENWIKGRKVKTVEDAEAAAEIHDYMNK